MKSKERRGRIGFPNLRLGLVAVSALFPAMMARAQEGLRNDLSVNQSTELPPAVQQSTFASLRLGPVLGLLKLNSSASYNDNIDASEDNRRSDEIITAGLEGSFYMLMSDQSELSLNLGIDYATYLQNSQDNTLDIAPDSALSWNISIPDGYVTLFDALSYTRQVYNEGALADITELPRWDNDVGARITWYPDHWITQAGYSYNNQFSGSSGYSYLNWDSHDIFARAGWLFAAQTQAGLEASASFTSYESLNQGDTTSYSLGAYTVWQVTRSIHAELHGGPTVYQFGASSRAASATLDSYYFDVNLSHQLTEYVTQALIAQRQVELGLNEGSQYIEDFIATYAVSWAATSGTVLSINTTYEQGSQPLLTTVPVEVTFMGVPIGVLDVLEPATENFKRYGGGCQIKWQYSEKLSTALSYNYWLRRSNLPGRNYVDNSVTLSLNYSF